MLICTANASAMEPSEYIPEIHGTFRGRYEFVTEDSEGRFQVRNARVDISGRIAKPIGYFFQTDLCDRGKMKILDAYGWINITSQVKFSIGQLRIPFSVDASRAPHLIYFANRSFIGRTIGNYRGVGAKLSWQPQSVPLLIEGGVYNSAAMSDHDVWQKAMAYGTKIRYRLHNVTAEIGFESLEPDSIRHNSFDCSLTWNCGRWLVEGEYLNKHYTNKSYTTTQAFNIMANYAMPVKAGIFNELSIQGRFDGATSNSSGIRNTAGILTEYEPSRRRASVGATLSYSEKKVRADLRLDFEKYFYRTGIIAPAGDRDRITAELIIRF